MIDYTQQERSPVLDWHCGDHGGSARKLCAVLKYADWADHKFRYIATMVGPSQALKGVAVCSSP